MYLLPTDHGLGVKYHSTDSSLLPIRHSPHRQCAHTSQIPPPDFAFLTGAFLQQMQHQ